MPAEIAPSAPVLQQEKKMNGANGTSNGVNGHSKPSPAVNKSLLQHTPSDEVHDLLCVGFGPASMGVAIALHDTLSLSTLPSNLSKLRESHPKVCFLERQPSFSWHAGMLLPGAHMQISFIKDMATFRDPRSEFTFLNYLHKNGRLVPFVNLSTLLPLREEYDDYLRWCANWFTDVVDYDQDVIEIVPEKGADKVKTFVVKSRNSAGEITTRRAKNVAIGVGGRANIPAPFPQNHPQILHSSCYSMTVQKALPDQNKNYRIAIIGNGQSGAEIFNDLHTRYPNAHTKMFIKGPHLRPSDDSPFVNEIFDPDRVDPFFNQTAEERAVALASDKPTNYGVVRLNLLEHLYSTMYLQRLRNPNEEEWPHRILSRRTVTGCTVDASGKIHLQVENSATKAAEPEKYEFDAVFVACGYIRNVHEDLLRDARGLMLGGDVADNKWQINRNYRVKFQDGVVSDDAGIYLQGCNEKTHGLSDTLLSVLANRSGEMVETLFGDKAGDFGAANGTAEAAAVASKLKSEANVAVSNVEAATTTA
ncbi:MAG: hypothetical protein M1834_000886 [Cirrosporium novae-zelandiae]|nr:MAG: hypothetical protein M1834_000886 [Cirrosporium novae-zelandiae]